ncbi:hypothetical protein EGR_07397 [Echinococcus granulosus]|uniref:Uncharacterized protein n=1 Tax=Echinococcus granulosus TaxID=6210 RepID=W6UI18_ECHGR|nr:hypothetical protein EGR_07397 [Echinococcus granulosus]EUB57737.1 hypothetical protein EGR_07397 [Echinococcus granulosus]
MMWILLVRLRKRDSSTFTKKLEFPDLQNFPQREFAHSNTIATQFWKIIVGEFNQLVIFKYKHTCYIEKRPLTILFNQGETVKSHTLTPKNGHLFKFKHVYLNQAMNKYINCTHKQKKQRIYPPFCPSYYARKLPIFLILSDKF